MKNFLSKRNVLIVGLLGLIFLVLTVDSFTDNSESTLQTFYLPIIFLLSVLVPFSFDRVVTLSKREIIIGISSLALCVLFSNMFFHFGSHTVRSGVLFYSMSVLFLSLLFALFPINILHSWVRFLSGWLPVSVFVAWSSGNNASFLFGYVSALHVISFSTISFSLVLVLAKMWEFNREKQKRPIALWIIWPLLSLSFLVSILFGYYVGSNF